MHTFYDSRGEVLPVFSYAKIEEEPLSAWVLDQEGICGAVEVVEAFDGRLYEDVGGDVGDVRCCVDDGDLDCNGRGRDVEWWGWFGGVRGGLSGHDD